MFTQVKQFYFVAMIFKKQITNNVTNNHINSASTVNNLLYINDFMSDHKLTKKHYIHVQLNNIKG